MRFVPECASGHRCIGATGWYRQVVVAGHQRVSMLLTVVLFCVSGQSIEVSAVVTLVIETGLAVVIRPDDVQGNLREGEARKSNGSKMTCAAALR